MLTTYRRLLDLFDAHERRRFGLLMAMVLVMGLVDMAGVASTIPFLGVLSNPAMVETSLYFTPLYDRLGFTAPHAFLLLLGGVMFAFVVFALRREYVVDIRLFATQLRQPYVWFLDRHSAGLGKSVLCEVDDAGRRLVVRRAPLDRATTAAPKVHP